MFDNDQDGLAEKINKYQPDVFILYDDDFNYLTKMCLENMRKAVFDVLKKSNKSGIFIAHGSDASDQAELYLKAGFDYVVHRNAEIIILQMLQSLMIDNREEVNSLGSVSYINDSIVVQNSMAKENLALEKMPLPEWDMIDLQPYRNEWLTNHGYFALNVSTAHGCPFRCNWCAKPLYGRTYNAFPAEKVAGYFAYLKKKYGVDYIWITDDIFALKPGWINEFADEIKKRNILLPYKIQSRADLMTESFVSELKRSGCDEIWLGVESGSQKILDAMQKDVTVAQINSATDVLKRHGIKVGYFLQYGYPGEDYTDIKKTLKIIKKNKPDHIGISVSYPLKGTPFYETIISQMGDKKNWRDSGDLALMYPGKYQPDFYRALHKFTHHYFGFVTILKKQPIYKTIRKIASQYKHIPGMIKYRYRMHRYLKNPMPGK